MPEFFGRWEETPNYIEKSGNTTLENKSTFDVMRLMLLLLNLMHPQMLLIHRVQMSMRKFLPRMNIVVGMMGTTGLMGMTLMMGGVVITDILACLRMYLLEELFAVMGNKMILLLQRSVGD